MITWASALDVCAKSPVVTASSVHSKSCLARHSSFTPPRNQHLGICRQTLAVPPTLTSKYHLLLDSLSLYSISPTSPYPLTSYGVTPSLDSGAYCCRLLYRQDFLPVLQEVCSPCQCLPHGPHQGSFSFLL